MLILFRVNYSWLPSMVVIPYFRISVSFEFSSALEDWGMAIWQIVFRLDKVFLLAFNAIFISILWNTVVFLFLNHICDVLNLQFFHHISHRCVFGRVSRRFLIGKNPWVISPLDFPWSRPRCDTLSSACLQFSNLIF